MPKCEGSLSDKNEHFWTGKREKCIHMVDYIILETFFYSKKFNHQEII